MPVLVLVLIFLCLSGPAQAGRNRAYHLYSQRKRDQLGRRCYLAKRVQHRVPGSRRGRRIEAFLQLLLRLESLCRIRGDPKRFLEAATHSLSLLRVI